MTPLESSMKRYVEALFTKSKPPKDEIAKIIRDIESIRAKRKALLDTAISTESKPQLTPPV